MPRTWPRSDSGTLGTLPKGALPLSECPRRNVLHQNRRHQFQTAIPARRRRHSGKQPAPLASHRSPPLQKPHHRKARLRNPRHRKAHARSQRRATLLSRRCPPRTRRRQKQRRRERAPRASPPCRRRNAGRSRGNAGRPPPPLDIVMVASEAHPYAHTGGLAEVVTALSEALGRSGHHVTLILPRYRGVDVTGAGAQRTSLQLGDRSVDVTFHTGTARQV